MNKEELIELLKSIIDFEKEEIENIPKDCVNSYGFGYSKGRLDVASRILNYVETGVDDYDI